MVHIPSSDPEFKKKKSAVATFLKLHCNILQVWFIFFNSCPLNRLEFWPMACNIKVRLLGLLLHNGAGFVVLRQQK